MISRLFCVALALLSTVLFSSAASRKPNVVLILADDLGISDLSCYGNPDRVTPNLDLLATQGVRFTTAYCAQPICSPSRAALLTGKSPARLHLTTYLPGRPDAPSQRLLHPKIAMELPIEEQTLPELLKPAGYTSACIGKWHLGGKSFGPQEQGFDVVFAGHANTQPSAEEGGKGEYELTAKGLEFIEQNRERPFFLYLAHNTPHIPLGAKPELVEAHGKSFNPTYAAMLETLDDTVGRVMAKLQELKLADDTILIFTSDNGGLHVPEGRPGSTPATRNAPFRAGKGFVYEGGLREPLIVRWPGTVKAGTVVEQPVSIADLMPTLLEVAGAAIPQGLDFQSIAPLLRGEAMPDAGKRRFYWHFPHYTNQGSKPAGAMREGQWKLVENYDDGRLELFDLAADPGETTDVSLKDPARVAAMRGALEAWRREVGAQENTPNPDYEPAQGRACYTDFDVSRLEPEASAAATSAKYAKWRAAMNTPVREKRAADATAKSQQPSSPAGLLVLRPRDATVHGEKLRYESLPQKDTLGFWVNASDWASWEVDVKYPGRYSVEVLQGCGKGNGGSTVEVSAGGQKTEFTVQETGHFQNFVPRTVGTLELAAGHQTVTLRATKKPGGAVMDLRRLTLERATE